VALCLELSRLFSVISEWFPKNVLEIRFHPASLMDGNDTRIFKEFVTDVA
jgi:hypothetical protein